VEKASQIMAEQITSDGDDRASTRDMILDAAERVVARDGARRLTIDAVVKESGYSKGGVLYNFPSKLDLIKGMASADDRCHTRSSTPPRSPRRTPKGARRCPPWSRAGRRKERWTSVSMGLLAALAENPELIDPIRDAHARMRDDLLARAPDPDLVRLVLLAVDGLHFSEILGLDILTPDERDAVEARLIALVSEPPQ
jgi:AcrR family transcriptional regulator